VAGLDNTADGLERKLKPSFEPRKGLDFDRRLLLQFRGLSPSFARR
jgi:hypothetical protein